MPEQPGKAFGLALAWLAAAMGGALAVGVALHLGPRPAWWPPWLPHDRMVALVTSTVTFAIMLWGARRQGRRLGNGSIRVGLGWGAIRRPGLLLVLGVLIVLLPPAWIGALHAMLHPVHQAEQVGRMIRPTPDQAPLLQIASWFMVAALAPLAEELFFRGWLWTALRRRWSFPATSVGAALPWLLLHMPDGALRPLYLLPAAILFSLARDRCGGVAASLTLHIVNNTLAVVLVALAKD